MEGSFQIAKEAISAITRSHMIGFSTRSLLSKITWFSLPEADGDKQLLSQGRSRMFMHTLLPEKAEILTRGGSGQEAWGHPLERTAQYNHTNRERSQPPICPWRMEIGDPAEAARTLFLNVFEITDEQVREAPDVTFVPAAGVKIGDRIIRFNATGPLGGVAGGIPLTTTINTATQYPTSN